MWNASCCIKITRHLIVDTCNRIKCVHGWCYAYILDLIEGFLLNWVYNEIEKYLFNINVILLTENQQLLVLINTCEFL